MPDSKPMQYRVVDRLQDTAGDEREAAIAALRATPARIEPKYFYDALGCALYGAICQLPEYYPTRTEAAIFREHRAAIAEAVGQGGQLVDLGAGDCRKAEAWLPFLNPERYVAVDIAAGELQSALARMAPDFPGVEMIGLVTDFTRGLPLEGVLDGRRCTFFYPGSSIGNFTPPEAVRFLARVRAQCASRPGSGLLIGVDAKKERARLDAAYDDALGVTAAFNRNVLLHLNRRLGSDFALEDWLHRGFYNAQAGRIEMHLESAREQVVQLPGGPRRFAAGERIHTENSYKYHAEEFESVLREAGFASFQRWSDAAQDYFVFYAAWLP
jgi:dimethylhistidine N-methyltransferase